MTEIAANYGARHPAYLNGQTKLENLRVRMRALREHSSMKPVAGRVTGQSFVPAQSVMVPSSPNIPLVLGVTAVVALGAGIWLALLLARPSAPRCIR